MSFEAIVGLAAGVLIFVGLIALIIWKFPKRMKREYFLVRWKRLQQHLPDK